MEPEHKLSFNEEYELVEVNTRIGEIMQIVAEQVFAHEGTPVRSSENMYEALEFNKKASADNKLIEEFDLLSIRQNELLTKRNGGVNSDFTRDDYLKLREETKTRFLPGADNPFIIFLSSEEREDNNHANVYERGVFYAIRKLAIYGWYINYHFIPSTIVHAAGLINDVSATELDRFMIDQLNAKLRLIEEQIIERHLSRKPIIEAAFRAHRSGEYYLSVPVLFTQADGICEELTEFKFFDKKKLTNKPTVAEWAESKISISLQKALASALFENGAFQLHRSNDNKINITRHSILHGESVDYGTETNSFKAISLLAYLNDLAAKEIY